MKFNDEAKYSFFAEEKLGNTRYHTPEGFLLCTDVKIARIGDLEYNSSELDDSITPDSNGIVILNRTPEDFFTERTISSFEGKPIVARFHQTVDPENFKDITVGNVSHVRREGDYLVADLMICDKDAIELVERNIIKEISIGYEADMEQTGIGRGRQFNIIGNHVALVREGRAGPSCAIGDSASKKQNNSNKEVKQADMSKSKKPSNGDALPIELRSSDVTDGNEEVVKFGTEGIAEPEPKEEEPVTKVDVIINTPAANSTDSGEVRTDSSNSGEVGTEEVRTEAEPVDKVDAGPDIEPEDSKEATLDSIASLEDLEKFIFATMDKYFAMRSEETEAKESNDQVEEKTEVVLSEEVADSACKDACSKGSTEDSPEGVTEVAAAEIKSVKPESIDPEDAEELPSVEELSEGVAVITPEIDMGLGDAPTPVIMRDVMIATIERYRKRDLKMDQFIRNLYGKKLGDSLDKLDTNLLTGLFRTIKEACKVSNNEKYRILGGKKNFNDSKEVKHGIQTAKDLAELYKSAHNHA